MNQLSAIAAPAVIPPERPLNIACVLRSGGVFDLGYVRALATAVRRRLRADHRFFCLTDIAAWNLDWFRQHRIIPLPLETDWPGWWAKMELFRPGLFRGQVLYFDLDTVIVKRIDKLASYRGTGAILRDFYHPAKYGSAIMSWRAGDWDFLYDDFVAEADNTISELHGDQTWIRHRFAERDFLPDIFQDLLPRHIVSYKPIPGGPHLRSVPHGARLVCFHGKPKPHDVADTVDWVGDHWF